MGVSAGRKQASYLKTLTSSITSLFERLFLSLALPNKHSLVLNLFKAPLTQSIKFLKPLIHLHSYPM